MIILQKPMEGKFVSSESILSQTSLCSYFVSWKIYLFTCKKNRLYEQHRNDYSIPHIFAIEAWKKMYFVELVFASRQLMEKMRNLILRSQCFNKIFSTKSKKEDTIHMGIIFMSFLSRNLLYKNIYTMPSFMCNNELFSRLKMMTRPLLYFCI